jgi:hypothetical protein
MLFRETVAVYCENHTEQTNALCGQDAEFWYDIARGRYSNHWALKFRMCTSCNEAYNLSPKPSVLRILSSGL